MSRAAGIALGVLIVLYPIAAYEGLQHVPPALIAGVIGAVWSVRAWWKGARGQAVLVVAATALYVSYIGLHASQETLRWYPVAVNSIAFSVFTLSLFRGMPVVERIARTTEPDLPPHAVAYTRKVTAVWSVFFLLNGTVAACTAAWAPWSWWAMYNGGISYVLTGLLFAVEWVVRQRVKAAA